MSQFNSLLAVMNDELKAHKELLSLLEEERAAVSVMQQDKTEKIQKIKTNLIEKLQHYTQSREGIVRSLLQVEDAKKPVKASDAVAKCPDIKLKKQLNTAINSLRTVSAQVKKANDHNAQLVSQALGIISSSLAIIRSTPDIESPTYGEQGKLKSEGGDNAFRRKRNLVTTA